MGSGCGGRHRALGRDERFARVRGQLPGPQLSGIRLQRRPLPLAGGALRLLAARAVGGASGGAPCVVSRGSNGVFALSESQMGQVSTILPLGPQTQTPYIPLKHWEVGGTFLLHPRRGHTLATFISHRPLAGRHQGERRPRQRPLSGPAPATRSRCGVRRCLHGKSDTFRETFCRLATPTSGRLHPQPQVRRRDPSSG